MGSLRQALGQVSGLAAAATTAGLLTATASSAQDTSTDPSFLTRGGYNCVQATRTFAPRERDTLGNSNVVERGGFTLTFPRGIDATWVKGEDAGQYATGSYRKPNGVVEQFGPGDFPNHNGLIEHASVSGVGAINTAIAYDGEWGESNKIIDRQTNGYVGDGTYALSFRSPNGDGQELFMEFGDIGPDDIGKVFNVNIDAPSVFLSSAIQRQFQIAITPESYDPRRETATLGIPLTGINARPVHVTFHSPNASHDIVGAKVGFASCRREGGNDRNDRGLGKTEGRTGGGEVDGGTTSLNFNMTDPNWRAGEDLAQLGQDARKAGWTTPSFG